MLKYILPILLAGFVYGQTSVMTQPKYHNKKVIYADAGDFKTLTTSDTTDAIDLRTFRGAVTMLVFSDVNGLSPANDKQLKFRMQVKNEDTDQWLDYYKTADGFIASDTLARALINHTYTLGGLGDDNGVYVPVARSDSWAVGPKVRWIFDTVDSGDKINLYIIIVGQ